MKSSFGLKELVDVCTTYEIRKAGLNHGRVDNMRLYGLCCPDSKVILLEHQQDHTELRDSFLHEALHAHGYITGKYYGMKARDIERITRKETKYLMEMLYGKG
jgi:hypothetical protein